MYPLTQPQFWRVERTRLRQERYDDLELGRTEHVAGYITGAAGGTFYTGDAWPPAYLNSIFTGDVSGNLIRRDVVSPDGVTFRARPAMESVEFLASNDQWFRPTNFANAPDGNLYLMDMQREFIETPLSVPEELRKQMDFYSGDTLGRIYRIVSTQSKAKRGLKVNLGSMDAAALVSLLDHDNGWHRQTAHRLLMERGGATAQLRQAAVSAKNARARVRALWLLSLQQALTKEDASAALRSSMPEVREHALRMAETLPALRQLEPEIAALRDDASIRVRYQLAFTLGFLNRADVLAAIALRDAADPWVRTAVLTSIAGAPAGFLTQLSRISNPPPELMPALAGLIGARAQPAEISALLHNLQSVKSPGQALLSLSRGLGSANARALPVAEGPLARLLDRGVEEAWEPAAFFRLSSLARRAAAATTNPRAVRALRGAPFAAAIPALKPLLAVSNMQTTAVEAIAAFDDPGVARLLLDAWKGLGPEARLKAVAALVGRRDRIPALLDAVGSGQIEPAALDIGSRNVLLENRDPALSSRAKALFGAIQTNRAAVLASHKDVLRLTGGVDRGKLLFAQNCAMCHLPRKKGGRVGPDLSGVSVKTKEELLAAILDPSAAIESRFLNYVVTTRDGRIFDGVLAAETPGSVTLRGGSDDDVTVLRANIAEIRASAISLMPEDMEKSLNKQNLADVIAYLRAGL
jgi:putative heme-binding domain-containing protein